MKNRTIVLLSLLLVLVAGCAPAASTTAGTVPAATVASAAPAADAADLGAIKTYLLDKTATLKASTTTLKAASDRYYALAQAVNFDYAALWAKQPAEVSKALLDAKAAWITASPLYEQMEGIVAGTPSLSQFDVNLDAGASAADGGDSVVPFDITLPNGKVLAKPGNLFGVTESTLFGTFPEYFVAGIEPDLDGNGKIDFGEVLPDANVLKGGVDLLDSTVGELATTAAPWQPTESEAFG
ncbi:MAG: EfeM/EfeO family lipoprotein, partial [Chloroflexi bacterium]|nr:EfeM/EfeO family lipoprotein [Chloroflexota bacterium]